MHFLSFSIRLYLRSTARSAPEHDMIQLCGVSSSPARLLQTTYSDNLVPGACLLVVVVLVPIASSLVKNRILMHILVRILSAVPFMCGVRGRM